MQARLQVARQTHEGASRRVVFEHRGRRRGRAGGGGGGRGGERRFFCLTVRLPASLTASLRLCAHRYARKHPDTDTGERKQTGLLTSAGVPSPPPSHGVSSPASGGLPTDAPPQHARRLLVPASHPCVDAHSLSCTSSSSCGNARSLSAGEAPHFLSLVVTPPAGSPLSLSSAHSSGLTVFPEVPCCQVTLCPSATTDRASPCTNPAACT